MKKQRDWIVVMMVEHTKPGAIKDKKKWDRKNKKQKRWKEQEDKDWR